VKTEIGRQSWNADAEFAALREELMQRAEFQQRTIHLAVVVAGAMLTVFFQFTAAEWVALIYPLLTSILAAEWAFNNFRIAQIGTYIRRTFEVDNNGWEHFLSLASRKTRLRWLSGRVFAYGIFVLLPLIAVLIVIIYHRPFAALQIAICILDALLVLLVTPFLIHCSEAGIREETALAEASAGSGPQDGSPQS